MAKSNLSYEELLKRFAEVNPNEDENSSGMAESLETRSGNDFTPEKEVIQKPSPSEVLEGFKMAQTLASAPTTPSEAQKVLPTKDLELEDARRKDAILDLIGGLNQAGQMFASAAARNKYKPDYDLFKNTKKSADILLENRKAAQEKLANQQEQERMDPKSQASVSTRQLLEKYMGAKLPELSYNDLVKSQLGPTIVAAKGREAALQARIAAMEQSNMFRERALNQKDEQIKGAKEARDTRMEQGVETSFNRANKPIQDAMGSGSRVLHMIDSIESGTLKGTPQQLSTITTKMANLITQGQSDAATRAKMDWSTAQSTLAKAEQFISANPNKAMPPSILNEIKKETKVLYDGLKEEFSARADALRDSSSSESRKNKIEMLKNSYLKQHEKIAGAKKLSSKQLSEYAEKHKMDPAVAKEFLEGKGYYVED